MLFRLLWWTEHKSFTYRKITSVLIFLVVILFGLNLQSQDDYVIVDSIHIVGLKKTQRNVIIKEIDFVR